MTLKSADARRPTLEQDAKESGERNKRHVATCFEGRRTRIGAAWVPPRMAARMFPPSVPAYAVAASLGGRGPGVRPPTPLAERPTHPAHAASARLAQQHHRLRPPP